MCIRDRLGPLGLNDALAGEGPFTVFLPSDNAALAAVADQPTLVPSLSSDPALAAALLGYHVVPGEFKVADLEPGTVLVTSTGQQLTIGDDGSAAGLAISTTDLMASNGVVHVIEGVLTPPPAPELAVTGVSSWHLVAGGLATVTLGFGLVELSRRRDEELFIDL